MTRKLSGFLLGVFLILIILGGGYYYYTNYYLPSSLPTLQPPLADVEFPSEQAQYPIDWPDELKLPKEFVLVDSSSGALSESTTKGWSAKLRYQGKPSEAVDGITRFFEDKGWTIVENNKLDSGGFALLIKRERGNGVVVLDTDSSDSSQTLIIITLFP